MKLRTISRLLAAVALASGALLGAAAAQPYPTRPVRLIVPFPPGGITDTLGRIVAEGLKAQLVQSVVVDNRPGASGAIGTELAVNAAPDGYTILLGAASTQVLNPLFHKFAYDPVAQLAPVGMVAETALLLVVPPSLPVQSVAQLIDWLKQHPDRANFGSYGEGSASHLAGELFKQMTAIPMTHVAYKGAAPAQMDLIAGELALMFSDMSAIPHVRGGKLRALAVTGPRRSAVLPDLPTVGESGLPGYDVGGWFAIFAPVGLPADVLARLRADLATVVATPALQARLVDLWLDPPATPVVALVDRMQAERAKMAKVIADAHIKLE